MQIKKDNYIYEYLYKTKSIAEASFLIAKGKIIESIERDAGICWFIFQDREKCQALAKGFWFESEMVEGKKYFEAFQTLKNHIFTGG